MKSQSHPSTQAQKSALRIRVVADKTVAGRAPQRIVGLRTGSEQRLWVRLLTISLVMSSPIIAAALSAAGIWLFRAAILFGLGLGSALLVYLTLPSDANGVGWLWLGDRRCLAPAPASSPCRSDAQAVAPPGVGVSADHCSRVVLHRAGVNW